MNNLHTLRLMMRQCPQTPTQNVLQHGASVWNYFNDLHSHITTGTALKYEWKLPDWVHDPVIWDNLTKLHTIQMYHVYHDCGKPLCRYVDENGKQHFPDHASISRQCWIDHGGSDDVGDLIAMDMDFHLLKAGGEIEFAQRPQSATLMITALCELHSNAAMFGGIESTSFKIKWKAANKFGKRVLQQLKGE